MFHILKYNYKKKVVDNLLLFHLPYQRKKIIKSPLYFYAESKQVFFLQHLQTFLFSILQIIIYDFEYMKDCF